MIEIIIESNPGFPVVVGGYFNARTAGKRGRAGENRKRSSKDKVGKTRKGKN